MINVDLFYFINHNLQNPVFDVIMPYITYLGGFEFVLLFCLIAILLCIVFKKKDAKRIALLCLLSLVIAAGIGFLLKHTFTQPRPYLLVDGVRVLVAEADPNAFPSGHTLSTFSVVGFLALKMKNKLWSALLIIWGLLVGFSRIYVGVHMPIDVLAGILVGMFSAYFVYKFEDKIIKIYHDVVGVFKR
ncbi:phosphatase PAP2 family protein [uncultured Methanobrevibacter sp.]|uniref:phosphatase PAP2 family protein n=1 Tax=uncultured Methanobrevibacter sp. TaxID=253161 RepID=UPI0037438834